MILSNHAPHSLSGFDSTRHFTGADIFYTSKYIKLLIKWSKSCQDRDKVQVFTLPKLKFPICPFKALRVLQKLYTISESTSLFQYKTSNGWGPVTDTRVRKFLQKIRISLGLRPHYFHVLRQSGATFAFEAHIPGHKIQCHRSWTSNCLWRYIQANHESGENLADALHDAINAWFLRVGLEGSILYYLSFIAFLVYTCGDLTLSQLQKFTINFA